MNPHHSRKEEALALLGIPLSSEEDWENVLEEQVFSIRNFLLSQPVTVLLFASRIRKLVQLAELEELLGGNRNPEPETARQLPPAESASLLALIRWRELCHSLSRTAMARHNEILFIAAEADQMCFTESRYEELFLELSWEISPEADNHSSSWRPDYGALILELSRHGISSGATRILAAEKARILARPSFPYHSPLRDIQSPIHES